MLSWHQPTPLGKTGAEILKGNCRLSFTISPVGDFDQEDLFGGTVWELRLLESRWFPSVLTEVGAPSWDDRVIWSTEFFHSIHDTTAAAKASAERLVEACVPNFEPVREGAVPVTPPLCLMSETHQC